MKNKIVGITYLVCFTFILSVQIPTFSLDCTTPHNKSLIVKLEHSTFGPTHKIEHLFKQQLPQNDSIIYNKVPRGLIISIKSKVFFADGEVEILESSKSILHTFAQILKTIPNKCIIESHSVNENFENSYRYNWELTTIRADKIVQYLIKEEKLNPQKIEAIGFGEIMPFFDNVNSNANLNRRIDFVIINYEKVEPLIKQ